MRYFPWPTMNIAPFTKSFTQEHNGFVFRLWFSSYLDATTKLPSLPRFPGLPSLGSCVGGVTRGVERHRWARGAAAAVHLPRLVS